MPYTLSMAFVWVVLAVALGVLIGWLMRSVVAKRQIERARTNHLDAVELERARARISELESSLGTGGAVEPDAAVTDVSSAAAESPSSVDPSGVDAPDEPVNSSGLTVIVGIGPEIAELCAGIGIVTWKDMADTEVSLLVTMLADAGHSIDGIDPSTWPDQARLLVEGRWDEHRQRFGRPTDESGDR